MHKFWIGASARKQYTIRPLESFRSMVQAAYAHDAGTLLTTRFEGRLAAFIHSALFKVGSVFLSGGHDPTINRGWDTRLLQYRAMCMAIERGIPYYSLSGPSTGGIRLFKEGFRPVLVDNMRFATIALRPVRASLIKPVVRQSQWINRLRSWAARSMRK